MTITCLPKESSYSKKENNNSPYCIEILMPRYGNKYNMFPLTGSLKSNQNQSFEVQESTEELEDRTQGKHKMENEEET